MEERELNPAKNVWQADFEEAEILEPEEALRQDPPSETSPGEASGRTKNETSTALVPTTTLSRYLAEVRRYPFLSK